jgi:pimeloyl-ACP methyl ester carboxylesterase
MYGIVLSLLIAGASAPACTAVGVARPQSDEFDTKGVKIHYLVAGQGEPVVLIHGLDSSAEINWGVTGVIAELATDHKVVALDMPGHGRSGKPPGDEAYGRQVVEDVVLLMDHLGIRKAHIVGYSLGGMVALKLISMHPDRVISGTLGGMGWLREGSPLEEVWERMPAKNGRMTPPAFVHSVGQLALSEDELAKIKVPVKVIVGDRDPVKQLYVMPLEKTRPDWSVVEIAGAGHLNCVFKPQFREEIASWVRENGVK